MVDAQGPQQAIIENAAAGFLKKAVETTEVMPDGYMNDLKDKSKRAGSVYMRIVSSAAEIEKRMQNIKYLIQSNLVTHDNPDGCLTQKAAAYYINLQWNFPREKLIEAIKIDMAHWQTVITEAKKQ